MPRVTRNRPIVLLTDFGHVDPFVGIIKGVILSINPRARVVDLSHGVRPQDILHGAFLLSRAMGYFPKGSIFCVVVDPGVGTGRRPIVVKTRDYYFVAPDNGVVWEAASSNHIDAVVHLTQEVFFLDKVSSTFQGRDIFAPVAAHLSYGRSVDELGEVIGGMERLAFPVPEKKGKDLALTVLDVDTYGNISLNLSHDQFFKFTREGISLSIGGTRVSQVCPTFAKGPENIPFLVPGSSGLMEVVFKNKSAASLLKISCMDKAVLAG